MGKPLHIQVYDTIKHTKKKIFNFNTKKPEEDMIVGFNYDKEREEAEELEEGYEELEDLEEEVREEKKNFWQIVKNFFVTETKKEDLDEGEMKEIERLEEEYEDLDEMEEDVEELEEQIDRKKENIFKRMFGMFKFEPKEEIDEFEEEFELNEDIKDIIKILTNWIKQLPPEKLKSFKESEDFERYKEILKRYNLIK